MKKSLIVFAVLAIVLTTCVAFTACADPIEATVTTIDYSLVLNDYLKYPDAANVASMDAIERNVADIYADSSLSDAEKVAQMMDRATLNEIDCEYFAYFMDKVGTTNMGSNSGTLIYQRTRKQSDTLKDDMTLKLPVNHTFPGYIASQVTTADIRYTSDGQLKRMSAKKTGDITYNEKTGLIEVANWKKAPKIGESWPKNENAKDSRSYDEARKSAINWSAKDIVSSEGITIVEKTDESTGKNYYELTFSINITAANSDDTTISRLENDNTASSMKYEYCNFVVEIWDCGLAKKYVIEESWNGKIITFSGSAESLTTVIFSYSEADVTNNTATEAIYQSLI